MTFHQLAIVLTLVVPSFAAAAEEEAVRLCEPWQSEYQGEDATGEHVIALWNFEPGDKVEDVSGKGRTATLRGATISPEGRFGACLESSCGWPVEDKEHRAMVANHPSLSPKGPFTLEMWIKPKAELNKDYPESFLLDKKYVAHQDYQLILGSASRSGERVLRVCLGFGGDSATWYAQPAKFEPGTWYHLAFTYDAAGDGRFYLNGLPWGGQRNAGREAVVPGKHPLSIGDRIGSYFHGFPGYIDQVRIANGVLEFRRARFEMLSDRSCFVRMESPAALRFALTNLRRTPLAEGNVSISIDGLAEKQVKLTNLAPGKPLRIDYPLDTTLRPDAYHVAARVTVPGADGFQSEERLPIRIVARRPPQFPVLMWGGYSPDSMTKELPRLKAIGFNAVLGLGADIGSIWDAGKPIEAAKPETVRKTRHMLDEALANDMTIAASLSPGHAITGKTEFLRVDRKGQPYKSKSPNICGLFPEVQKFCYNVGASVAQTYGQFPAFRAALLHTEIRDGANLCFHKQDVELFRQQTGLELPAGIGGRGGVLYSRLPDFPASRVIPDDFPLYVYYRWYWKTGDGWNGLNTALHRGLKSTGRTDLWTWHDPAVRVASVYGSGGEVDILSQWTYSYPDPIRIGLATDELLAMVGGAATKQQVMKMTQVIWYRGQTAPIPKKPADVLSYQATWEKEQPGAPFITIAPMHLREAFWTKIARPIKGIMYHGWQSLVPCDTPGGYCYTHPETQHELARLVRQVIRPLGPTLLQVPSLKSDVAFLESFASQMFAQRGTYGWGGGWTGDAYHAMLYAHLQPEIVFDETVASPNGLDGFRVLVMADCDVITETMRQRIKAFQAKGGIIVGDDRLAPAIKPDIVLQPTKRTGRNDVDKAAIQAVAAELRKQLDSRYARKLDSSNPEVIPYLRHSGAADYVFLVNDHREYGQYVGQHGLVMENGLPSQAVVSLNRPAGVVYDRVNGCQVPARQEKGKLRIDVALGPCDGRLYMVLPRAIERVKLQSPASTSRGGDAKVTIEVVDAEGRPIEATVPLKVDIRDAEGRLAEFSGFHRAVNGRLELTLHIAANDPMGTWQLEARELASGRSVVGSMRVPGPQPWPPSPKPAPKEAANAVQPKG